MSVRVRLVGWIALCSLVGCGEAGIFLGSTTTEAGSGGGAGGAHDQDHDEDADNGVRDGGHEGSGTNPDSGGAADGGTGGQPATGGTGGMPPDAGPPGCPALSANCDGDGANGCETDIGTDPNNCGACDRVCPATGDEVDGAACVAGRCELVCHAFEGYADCDGDPGNGCEVNTRTSRSHCGACLNACTSCVNGTCN